MEQELEKLITSAKGVGVKWIIRLFVFLFAIIILVNTVGNIDSTEYIVKQSLGTGEMTVHKNPGWYMKSFGKVREYPRTGSFFFSEDELDGGNDADAQPLLGTMMGNSEAKISGTLKFRLPTSDSLAIALHRDYKDYETIRMELVRTQVATAIRMASPLFSAEEAVVYRRPEFTKLVREILETGEFKTYVETVVKREGTDSTPKEYKVTKIVTDSLGNRVITKASTLAKYGISVISLDIKSFHFDTTTTQLLEANKKATTSRIQAENAAITSKQMALTAAAKAEADVAKAKGEEEVSKIRAVTLAQKEQEVAELGAKKAKAQADSTRSAGEAEAYANKLKVAAGLTPLERATIDKETRIGVAAELAKTQYPSTMIIGGGNGQSSPMEAIGLRAMYDLVERASNNVVQKGVK